ncbi:MULTISPECIES: flagellar hook-length control protein FliK [Alphaproteobacteria]|uniref:Flagellar hook-length control protein-like C-terminal domain-containing protein n=2 Tax=Alphaproteobacteria TaxID=28211 RepID=A0A512HIG7_9HYPH|nr:MULTISPECIES: flagellar hook-length control protein FliK [Alphaproteobacteria]GEO85244.1 hypothetical protein RNA01_21760 [Ciceribacter naphthalenivorans]GLR24422.1 hypothetical protein GCM10007920_42160 [Ciceribacter naphthalenivorans]GLT07278.1 hypothetical protein GCM10007926_42160 [Sphingomonas psychrolutea]
MIETALAPKVTSAETTLTGNTASQRADTEAGNGFFNALSNAGHSGRKGAQHEDKGDVASPATGDGAETEVKATEADSARPSRPLIDLSRTSLSRAASVTSAETATAGDAGAEETTTADASPVAVRKTTKGGNGAPITIGATATAEALGAGQAATVAQHAQTTKGAKAQKSDEPADTGEVETTITAETDETSATQVSEIGDVLTLLNGTAVSAEQAAFTAPARIAAATDGAVVTEATEEIQITRAMVRSELSSNAGTASETTTEATTEATTADADRSFRFQRADGKGQTLQMSVGSSDGEMTKYDIGAAKDAGQTVTVLDARRYIAPASTNAAGITAAIMGDGEWASAMLPGSELANAASQSSSGKVVNTLKLQMSPIELGKVTATLRLTGDELSVQLTVETHAAYKALRDDQGDMLKALKAHGFAVDQVQISLAVGSGDRADGGQTGAQGQQTGQQANGGAQGGSGSGERREAQTQAGTSRASGAEKTSDDTSAAQAGVGGAGASRSGDVYL